MIIQCKGVVTKLKHSLILFSPTGGTERSAEILCSELGDRTQTTDLSEYPFDGSKFSFEKDGIAVIAVPSFGGRVPSAAAERIKALNGNGAPCVVMCVYGNRAYEDTLAELSDLAKAGGFEVIAAVAAVAQHSIMPQYATGRPDETDEKNLREAGKEIAQKFSVSQSQGNLNIPGNRPYKKAGSAGLVPKAGSSCSGCGQCAEKCPVGAIDKSDIKKTDKSKCISCMRCVTICPAKARTVNGAMVSVAAMTIKKACSVRKECEIYI